MTERNTPAERRLISPSVRHHTVPRLPRGEARDGFVHPLRTIVSTHRPPCRSNLKAQCTCVSIREHLTRTMITPPHECQPTPLQTSLCSGSFLALSMLPLSRTRLRRLAPRSRGRLMARHTCTPRTERAYSHALLSFAQDVSIIMQPRALPEQLATDELLEHNETVVSSHILEVELIGITPPRAQHLRLPAPRPPPPLQWRLPRGLQAWPLLD